MNTATPLETRLRQLDLRFVTVAPEIHVPDERMALMVAGADPTEAEAAHLAACDECLDVLVALGDGLESLESLGAPPGLSSLPTAPVVAARSSVGGRSPVPSATSSGAKNKRRLGLVLGGLGFAFTAAAAVGLVTYREMTPEVAAPGASATPEVAPVASATPAVAPAEPIAAISASASTDVSTGRLAAEPPVPRALPGEATGEPAEEPARPRPVAAAPRPSASPASPLAGPAAVATTVGEIEERDAAAFGRAPVNAAGRGFGFLRLSATPQAQVFIDDKPYGWTPVFDLRLAEGPHDVRLVYTHPNAAEPEERFRVVIPAEEHWVVKRKNLRRTPP